VITKDRFPPPSPPPPVTLPWVSLGSRSRTNAFFPSRKIGFVHPFCPHGCPSLICFSPIFVFRRHPALGASSPPHGSRFSGPPTLPPLRSRFFSFVFRSMLTIPSAGSRVFLKGARGVLPSLFRVPFPSFPPPFFLAWNFSGV